MKCQQNLEKNDATQLLFHKIEYIDIDGYFYEIFVRVIIDVISNFYPDRIGDVNLLTEIEQFLDFIYKIAKKRVNETVPLDFIGKYIRIAIILLKKKDTYGQHGEQPYLRRFDIEVSKGVEFIFLKQLMNTI